MITMLDYIQATPSRIRTIISTQNNTYATFDQWVKEHPNIRQIYLIGSGSSYTASIVTMRFIEKVSQLETHAILPNDFLGKEVYPDDALYILISQTGTSHLTKEVLYKLKEKGLTTFALTEAETTPIGSQADIHIDLGCGKEEIGMRTVGYNCTVFNLMLIGLRIAKIQNLISEEVFEDYMQDAIKAIDNLPNILDATNKWIDAQEDTLNEKKAIILYGAGPLWGIALEAAMKILEVDKRFICVGYEIDDGLHGPDMAFHSEHAIIMLNNGGKDDELLQKGAKYMKEVVGCGYIIGKNIQDNTDLPLDIQSTYFYPLEFAPVIQLLSYRLAIDYGIPVETMDKAVVKSSSYFKTHDKG